MSYSDKWWHYADSATARFRGSGSGVRGNGIIMEIHPGNRAPTEGLTCNPSNWSDLCIVVLRMIYFITQVALAVLLF